ncbi:MAG TPA: hypothetical protein VFQ53_13250 [Kofleriaceae bacterium]|nr:hypothetical protein [Kofleriaceae bacterium]
MSSVAVLEAALQTRWDRETLAVYGDALSAAGDPRGELIALELTAARTPEVEARRRALLVEWLGGETFLDQPWPWRNLRFGLLEDIVIATAEELEALLASPAGPYLRGLTIAHGAAEVAHALRELARQPRPWLRRLAIRQYEQGPIPAGELRAFVAATPHLDELDLAGERIAATPLHPGITTLRLQPSSIVVTGAALPQVRVVDLAFEDGELAEQAAMLNPRLFPNVVELDLARNENVYPRDLPSNVGVVPFLDAVEAIDRLRRLRLPSPRLAVDILAIERLLDQVPHLEIEIARRYVDTIDLASLAAHPRLRVPPPRPWPARDVTAGREALTVIAGPRSAEELALASIIDLLEDRFDAMPDPARAAWRELFEFLDGLGWEDEAGQDIELPFPSRTLAVALRELADADRRCAATLALIDKRARDTVILRRYWGW